MNTLAEEGAALLGAKLKAARAIHGGDLSQIVRIALADGREAIVKNGPAPRAEAAMLRAIAETGAPAPRVLAFSDGALVIEFLPSQGSLTNAWASLGEALALLHASTGSRYGWGENYAFGPIVIENQWLDDWPTFWAERRMIVHCAHISPSLARRIETLATGLPNRLPARPIPSLLHGDLWGGNILVSGNRVSGLIDPACYHGHSEVDLGMLTLFDRPSANFFHAYTPLQAGHEERLPIYQLWPALVHLRLFGEGYRSLVERLLSAAGV